jgi:hypothetical protein
MCLILFINFTILEEIEEIENAWKTFERLQDKTSFRRLYYLENRSFSFRDIRHAFLFMQPFKPEFSDLDYADVDYKSYGPINYKAASIALFQKQQQQQQRQEQQQQAQQPQRLLDRRPQMYGDDNEELL